jgi:branched-chain amino acid transport system ATP-binding protein
MSHDKNSPPENCSILLKGEKVSKLFGGLVAVKEVDFHILQGEIVGLIGPNGAGKTTLFNLIGGLFHPSTGAILFEGAEITALKPVQICHKGIARTYQIVRPFLKMNCLENVLIGIIGRPQRDKPSCHASGVTPPNMKTGTEGSKAYFRIKDKKKEEEEAAEFLRFVGLAGKERVMSADLTLIDKKRLEMARALACRPRLLLLDEVMAGLNPTEINQALELVEIIRGQFKITLFWIEHVMGAIMKASNRIIVLDQGQKIMEGSPEQVVADPRVIEAYLGENHAYSKGN